MEASINSRNYNSELRIYNNRLRRNRELKRHIFVFALSIVLFLAMLFLFSTSKSVASNKEDQILYKHFDSIQIKAGDTLTTLAEQYVCEGSNTVSSFIKEVRYINNLDEDDVLISGNYIIVPYYSTKQS